MLFFFGSHSALSQEKYTLSGTVTEEETGETLIGVNVLIPELQAGAITNEYGYYSITLTEGNYDVYYSSLGFLTRKTTISLFKKVINNIALSTNAEELDEVIVKADLERLNIRKPQMSVNTLSSATIKKFRSY